MLHDAEQGIFDVILTHKYDRLARSIVEHVNLEVRLKGLGVTLIAVAQDFGQSNEAVIMRSLMYSLSEYYHTFKKMESISAHILPGHDEKVFGQKAYPI